MNIIDFNYEIDYTRCQINEKENFYTYINNKLKKFYIMKEKVYKNEIIYRYYFGWLKNIDVKWQSRNYLTYRKFKDEKSNPNY